MPDPTDTQIQEWADEAERGYDFSFQEILVKRLHPAATMPTRATDGSAAWDLYAIKGAMVFIDECTKFPLGFAMAIPEGYAGLILPRSGLASKQGLRPANTPGLIDSDYRGEVIVALTNDSNGGKFVAQGDRIAQLLIVAVPTFRLMETALDLPVTGRGSGGFGSSGS